MQLSLHHVYFRISITIRKHYEIHKKINQQNIKKGRLRSFKKKIFTLTLCQFLYVDIFQRFCLIFFPDS